MYKGLGKRKRRGKAVMPPHTKSDIEWPEHLFGVSDHSDVKLFEALAFLLELGHYACDSALVARMKAEKGSFQPLLGTGKKKALAPEVKSFVTCRVYSVYPQFPDELCPIEFRPFKARLADRIHALTDALLRSVLKSLNVTEAIDKLRRSLDVFINSLLRKKILGVHRHIECPLSESIEIDNDLPVSDSDDIQVDENSQRSEYQISNLNLRLLQTVMPTIGLGHHNINAYDIDRNVCFDAIRSIIDSLGALASEFDMPFVAFLADSNLNEEVDGKPIKAYCVDRLNHSEENARIHSYCIDDMTRYFVRYVIDNAKYTTKRASPENILWIKSTAFKNQEALSLLLTPTEDLTDIKEDEDAIIEALNKYLLSTYRLRKGCENTTTIPWRDIADDLVDGNETYVENNRLPMVLWGGCKVRMLLQSPDILATSHCIAFALHILKGERGLLPYEDIFSWTDTV